MFRDARGVVHTVCSADPLLDLPGDAAAVLQRGLLLPVEGDLGGALERCEAAAELIERWQDAFFTALPDEIDLAEEGRWAAEAGLSLEQVHADDEAFDDEDFDDEDSDDEAFDDADEDDDEDEELLELDRPPDTTLDTGPRSVLPAELVAELERALLLLPLRVRLEALVAAADLVDGWADLFADHEKALGHLVLSHAEPQLSLSHEALADRHAALHAAGPGHQPPAA